MNRQENYLNKSFSVILSESVNSTAPPAFDVNQAWSADKEAQWIYYFIKHPDEVKEVLNGETDVLCVRLTWMEEKMPDFAEAMKSNETISGSYIGIGNKLLRKFFLEDHAPSKTAYIRFSDQKRVDEIAKEVRADETAPKKADEKETEEKTVTEEERKKGMKLLLAPELLVDIKTDLEKRICFDNILRNVILMAGISAYGQDQLNLFLQGPSSTGKTFVVTETLKYFPKKDVWFLGGLSATALVHDRGEIEEIDGETFKVVDLSHKILVFLESPNLATVKRLLPILSHDTEEIEYRITDKNAKGQHETIKVLIRGFPAVIFCTTVGEILKDLSTRSLIYAPEVSEEKIEGAINLQKKAATQPWKLHEGSGNIIEQVRAAIHIINEDFGTAEVAIPDIDTINLSISTDPRIMRDNKKRLELIKSCARLHAYQRLCLEYTMNGVEHRAIIANFFDILVGLTLFDEIGISTTTGLAPAVIEFFNKVLKPLQSKGPCNYAEMQEKHHEIYKQVIGIDTVRKSRIDPLEQAGYVTVSSDEKDKRYRYFSIAQDIPTFETAGKSRIIKIGDVSEQEKGKIWLLESFKIADRIRYMYRGNYHSINPSNSRRDSSAICRYLYTPIAIRYFQKVFPELGELTESEISGIFKSPLYSGNSEDQKKNK